MEILFCINFLTRICIVFITSVYSDIQKRKKEHFELDKNSD